MVVETSQGTVTAERLFNTNKLRVRSTDPRVESGEYGTRIGKLNANTDLWLKLIGIDERHSVIYKRTFDEIRSTYHFGESCPDTVPQAIVAFLKSTDFKDAIRNAISLVGDSDTLLQLPKALPKPHIECA